jgi:hypothetical protein
MILVYDLNVLLIISNKIYYVIQNNKLIRPLLLKYAVEF